MKLNTLNRMPRTIYFQFLWGWNCGEVDKAEQSEVQHAFNSFEDETILRQIKLEDQALRPFSSFEDETY